MPQGCCLVSGVQIILVLVDVLQELLECFIVDSSIVIQSFLIPAHTLCPKWIVSIIPGMFKLW